MDLKVILDDLKDCTCGKKHTFDTEIVEIGPGLVHKAGQILRDAGFPKKMLLVCDVNTLAASDGLLESLESAAFVYEIKQYDNFREAYITEVEIIQKLLQAYEGVLAVGTGSIGDVCRLAAYREKKEFAIFATAPSMDGFASDTSPTIHDGFKSTIQAKQPRIIIADTNILAASPAELKSSGFGDMIAKMIGLVDWKVSVLTTGEYTCQKIVDLTQSAVDRMISLADDVTSNSPETAGAIMEALVFTGLAMKLAGSSRPGSGTEHILSHFWECKQLAEGIMPDFHGKKVGIGTVIANKIYREMAQTEEVFPVREETDWEKVKDVYGTLADEMMALNTPDTITDHIDPEDLRKLWPQIREIVNNSLMPDEELLNLMRRAGAATSPEEVGVSGDLLENGIKYHPYMRRRMTLMRLRPMLGI